MYCCSAGTCVIVFFFSTTVQIYNTKNSILGHPPSDPKFLQKVPVKYRQKDDHISSARIFESAQHVSLIFTAIAQLKDIKTPYAAWAFVWTFTCVPSLECLTYLTIF